MVIAQVACSLPAAPPTLRVLVMPEDINQYGDVFGGWILSKIDTAGAIVAARSSFSKVVTVAVNSVQFRQSVFVGDVVSFYAKVCDVGRTSITIAVEVYAESRQRGIATVKITESTLTYVSIDKNGVKRRLTAIER